MPAAPINPTHYYKNKPVEFVRRSYIYAGQQHCVVIMINKHGRRQRQTVQERNLVEIAKSFFPLSSKTVISDDATPG